MRVRRSKTYKRSYDKRGGWYCNDADAPIVVRINAWDSIGIIIEDRHIGPRETVITSSPTRLNIMNNLNSMADREMVYISPLLKYSYLD